MLKFAKFVMLLVVDCKRSSTSSCKTREAVKDEKENQIFLDYYGLIEYKNSIGIFSYESYEFLEFESRRAKVVGKLSSRCSFKPLIQSDESVTQVHGALYMTL